MTTTESDVAPEGTGSSPAVQATRTLATGTVDDIVTAAGEVAATLASGADRHDREGSYAAENIAAIWDAGLGSLLLSREHGGLGADLTTATRVVARLAEGDPSTALIYVMHLVHLDAVVRPGSPWPVGLRAQIVGEGLAGPALVNALRVEPELGTPARGGVPASRAVPVTGADGRPAWRLNGSKIYSTGSHGLRWMLVWGATAEDDPDGQRVGWWVVEADTPGVEIVETWDHLGMRASASHDVVFHDVEVPLERAVDLQAPGRAPDPAAAVAFAGATTLTVAVYLGVLRAGRDWLAGYLNDRVPTNLGASLATLPRFQTAMGEIEALVHTSETLLYGLAADIDAGGSRAATAASVAGLTKVVVTDSVIRALEAGLRLIGNPGLSYHHPLQRHYRNALCSRIHTPQDDVVLTAAGRGVLQRAAMS